MGSSRLPGKVLKDIVGQSMLERVIARTRRMRQVHEVVVATSTDTGDDPIVELCSRLNVAGFRGHETDVLDRYLHAGRAHHADVCVRITSDCPLIDPALSDEIVDLFLSADPRIDYASNKIPQSYPRGLDTEVFTIDALDRAHRAAHQPYERSHVTIYMYEHPTEFRLLSIKSDVDRADWRWCVDTPEDLEFVRRAYTRLGADGEFGWKDLVSLLEHEPELRAINQHVVQKAVQQG